MYFLFLSDAKLFTIDVLYIVLVQPTIPFSKKILVNAWAQTIIAQRHGRCKSSKNFQLKFFLHSHVEEQFSHVAKKCTTRKALLYGAHPFLLPFQMNVIKCSHLFCHPGIQHKTKRRFWINVMVQSPMHTYLPLALLIIQSCLLQCTHRSSRGLRRLLKTSNSGQRSTSNHYR